MFKLRAEGSKALKFLFLVYIAFSVLYTMNYFYVVYSNNDASNSIKPRNSFGLDFQTSEWGDDKLYWKSNNGKYFNFNQIIGLMNNIPNLIIYRSI